MSKRLSYTSHVRAPDGRVASIDALASGLARVAFADKSTKLIAKSALRGARWNSSDRPERKRRPSLRQQQVDLGIISKDHKEAPVPRSTILAGVCAALGIDPRKARQRLRKAGLNAPYDNEVQLRQVLK